MAPPGPDYYARYGILLDMVGAPNAVFKHDFRLLLLDIAACISRFRQETTFLTQALINMSSIGVVKSIDNTLQRVSGCRI